MSLVLAVVVLVIWLYSSCLELFWFWFDLGDLSVGSHCSLSWLSLAIFAESCYLSQIHCQSIACVYVPNVKSIAHSPAPKICQLGLNAHSGESFQNSRTGYIGMFLKTPSSQTAILLLFLKTNK